MNNESRIIGTGNYLPEKILTNADLEKMVDTTDEWITTRTGIKERHIAADNQASSDFGYEAAKRALEMAQIKPTELDLIICATISPDMIFPNTGALIAKKLGCKTTAAFDIEAACSGFLFGLSIANNFIKTGKYKYILVVAAETLTRITDWQDRNTCVLFGDGAGAAVVGPGNSKSRIIDIDMFSDGTKEDLLNIPAGGSKLPASDQTIKDRLHYMKMKGNEVFKYAVTFMTRSLVNVLKNNNIDQQDIKFLIPHQANKRIIDAIAKRVKLPYDRVVITLDKYGNMSAATIIVALDDIVRAGKVKEGDLIAMTAFGGGFTWASGIISW